MRKIDTSILLVPMFLVVAMPVMFAQGPPKPLPLPPGTKLLVRAEGETPVPGKCLFKEDLDLIEARRTLTRTTLNDDQEAPFNPDYLVGRWKFEYDVPASAFGPEGAISGTQTIQFSGGCLYESNFQAKGPGGPYTVKSTMIYDPSAHYMVILDHDSRGFEVLKSGKVGGDGGGGFYTLHWEAAPLTVKGKKVKLKGTMFMSSPVNYRERTEISEGEDPYVNLGTVWMQRQAAAGAK